MGFFTKTDRATAPPAPVALSVDPDPSPMPEPVAVAGGDPAPHSIAGITDRAERVALDHVLAIPSVRKAQHVIAGTIATFELLPYDRAGVVLEATGDRQWLTQPEPRRTRQTTITRTIQDLIWRDRAVWRVTDTSAWGAPVAFERVNPARISTVTDPLDPDRVEKWIIDGREVPERRLVVFDGAGLGGLTRYGYDLLTIYGQLQAAAGRYARAPQPYAILKNAGADLNKDEIDALLDRWDRARETRNIGYLNDVIDYETVQGYSARELQLVEAREHAALEVARLFALPAFALDANQPGSSMTYGNVVDRRRDLLEALRPWMSVIEQTLSMDDRRGRVSGTVLPHGTVARFNADAYTRDNPETRMQTWAAALTAGVLTLDEVRTIEPLTRN